MENNTFGIRSDSAKSGRILPIHWSTTGFEIAIRKGKAHDTDLPLPPGVSPLFFQPPVKGSRRV